jgi:hypothetical protein
MVGFLPSNGLSLTHHCFTDKLDCFVGSQFQGLWSVLYSIDECLHQLWPFVSRDFNGGNGRNEIRGLT